MSTPQIALLMSTYQKPEHLRRSLESIALQQGVADAMELVVTDDGSSDETPRVVEDFARSVPFRVGFTTHPHTTFRLSAAATRGPASTAGYLLFLDGDCILPPDHVRIHLQRRRPGLVMAGDCCRMDEQASCRVSSEAIRSGAFRNWAPASELKRLRKLDRASRILSARPSSDQTEADRQQRGDLAVRFRTHQRLRRELSGLGMRRRRSTASSAQGQRAHRVDPAWTFTYHIWHPPDVTAPTSWKQGANVDYLLRKGRLTRCRNGLEKRGLDDLSIRIVGQPARPTAVEQLVRDRFAATRVDTPEVEILFLPGSGRFTGRADCNILVAPRGRGRAVAACGHAHWTIALCDGRVTDPDASVVLDQFEQALGMVA